MTRRLPFPAERDCAHAGVNVHVKASTITTSSSNRARIVGKRACDLQPGVFVAFLLGTSAFIFVGSFIRFTGAGSLYQRTRSAEFRRALRPSELVPPGSD